MNEAATVRAGSRAEAEKSNGQSGGSAPPEDLHALVQTMAEWRKAPIAGTFLIVISPGAALPQTAHSPELNAKVCAGVGEVVGKHQGRIYRTSASDFAVMLRTDQQTVPGVMRDLKIQLLRAIETHCAKSFGSVDQNRLVTNYDLAAAYRPAAERVSKYAAAEQPVTGSAPADTAPAEVNLRPFTDMDAGNVMLAYNKMGAEKFAKAFVRHQSIILNEPNQPMKHVMNEYFISMDLMRKALFPDAELRGSGRMFNDFTLVLDQIFLRAYKKIQIAAGSFSINLNVQSVFTKAFEIFLDEMPQDRRNEIVFEFRQPNIVEHFDEFSVARGVIHSKGAKIAVDQIFPEALGLVDLSYLGAATAKLQWRDDADRVLRERAKALKYLVDCGVEPVIIRVDDPRALEVGADLGVKRFQGFLIDEMMRRGAA